MTRLRSALTTASLVVWLFAGVVTSIWAIVRVNGETGMPSWTTIHALTDEIERIEHKIDTNKANAHRTVLSQIQAKGHRVVVVDSVGTPGIIHIATEGKRKGGPKWRLKFVGKTSVK